MNFFSLSEANTNQIKSKQSASKQTTFVSFVGFLLFEEEQKKNVAILFSQMNILNVIMEHLKYLGSDWNGNLFLLFSDLVWLSIQFDIICF